MTSDQLYQAHVNLLFKEWAVRLNDLKEKAENVSEASQSTYLRELEKLSRQKNLLSDQIQEIKNAETDGLKDIQTKIDGTLSEMDQTFYTVLSHLK
jgi:predicted  nucleic acid-binding Zn-ribbon protein